MGSEEKYFAQVDREQKERLRAQLDAEKEQAEKEERKQLHWHKCGKCGASMDSKPFRGVEIDVCPECGAVLLDAGELETLAGSDQSGVIAAIFSAFGRNNKK